MGDVIYGWPIDNNTHAKKQLCTVNIFCFLHVHIYRSEKITFRYL